LIDLPHPVLGAGRPEKDWIVATADKTTGLFSHMDKLRVGRYDYPAMKKVQSLDKEHSMIYGVNVHYPEIRTDTVAKSTKRLFDWDRSYENWGDTSKPEVPVNNLAPGQMIFIDHATIVTYKALNPYAEEVIVDLNANGRITNSTVSYSSEPPYLVKTRYRAVTTLMERKRGGVLIVGRWG